MPHNESQPLLANETADATCGVSFGDQSTAIEAEPQTTAEQLSEMRAYGQRKLFCHLVDTALDVTTLAIVAFLLAKPLDQWLESWAAFQVVWTRLGVLFLSIAVAQYAVSFPLFRGVTINASQLHGAIHPMTCDQQIIVDAIDVQLKNEPGKPTRNRKPLEDNPLAPWELRVGDLRVFYDIREDTGIVVIVAVGRKVHNRLFIGGEEIAL